MRSLRVIPALMLMVVSCGDGGAAVTSTAAVQTTAAVSSTTSTGTSSGATSSTTSTPGAPTTVPSARGSIAGTVTGWPEDAVTCRAAVSVFPGHQSTVVPCDPADPGRPVTFRLTGLLPGEQRIWTTLEWTDPAGEEHARREWHADAWGYEGSEAVLAVAGEESTVALVVDLPSARIVGTMRDGRNGLPYGGQFEPGASGVAVAAVQTDGTVVAWPGNDCDGSYEAWVPPGRYALLGGIDYCTDAPADCLSYWALAWALSGTPSEITGARLSQADSEQGTLTPLTAEEMAGAEWFDVPPDGVVTVDVSLRPGAADPPPGLWFEGLPPAPELAADDPRRDPGFWLGNTMTFTPTPSATRPTEEILLDGQDTGLWAAVQSRAPDDPDLPRVAFAHPVEGHDLCWDPGSGYGFLFAVGADGQVLDAVALDLGETSFACWHHGEPQPLPDPRPTVVLGHREHACGPPSGSVAAAWVLEDTGLIQIDPGGAYYLYPYG
jgi:hypothetical protein